MRTTASSFAPLWDRQSEWERRMAMVREARAFLYQSLFYIEYDAYGRQMLAALLDAQRRGVRVQLILDGFGQKLGGVLMTRADRAALGKSIMALRQAGGVVTFYRPPRFVQRRLAGGHHVKIQVSERGEAILSSGNITKSSFEGWNEYAMAVRGAVVPILLESCRLIGGLVEDEDLRSLAAPGLKTRPPAVRTEAGPSGPAHAAVRTEAGPSGPAHETGDLPLEYWFCNPNLHQGIFGALGWRGPNRLTDKMTEMVDASTLSLLITSFYFKPTQALMAAVVRAAQRGVAVEVFHSHPDALPVTDLAWVASATGYARLLEAGVHLYENRHGEHSKIVLVDDEWVACGSYNFEDAAHDRLAEAMLASRDDRVVAPAREIFDGLRRDPDNEPVTLETVRQWPALVRRRVARYGRFKRWM